MGISIKTLIIVSLTNTSFVSAQAVPAGDAIELSGAVFNVDQDRSEIWVALEEGESAEIIGFPFHNLEAQLEEELGKLITIDVAHSI